MNLQLENKLVYMYESIMTLNGFCDFDWCGRLLYPYYLHFNDDNKKYREGSLIAFYGLLTEWEDQSGFPFFQGEYEDNRHHFDKYLKAFIRYKPMIKADYPNVYKLIIRSLSFLDNRDDFEEQFPMLDLNLVNTIRSHLLKYKIEVSRQESRQIYYNAFKEVGVNLLTY